MTQAVDTLWIGYANCGKPYFACSTDAAFSGVVKSEMRYIRPRGGDLCLVSRETAHSEFKRILESWPDGNPVVQHDFFVRVEPSTEQ